MSSDVIIASIAILVSGLLLTSNLYLRMKNRKLTAQAAQAEVDRLSVYVQTQELLRKAAEESKGSDGFIKFMSQSRDWAFEYIEKVQDDLYELKAVFDSTSGTPKTVAQTNAMREAVTKVLSNLPEEDKNA